MRRAQAHVCGNLLQLVQHFFPLSEAPEHLHLVGSHEHGDPLQPSHWHTQQSPRQESPHLQLAPQEQLPGRRCGRVSSAQRQSSTLYLPMVQAPLVATSAIFFDSSQLNCSRRGNQLVFFQLVSKTSGVNCQAERLSFILPVLSWRVQIATFSGNDLCATRTPSLALLSRFFARGPYMHINIVVIILVAGIVILFVCTFFIHCLRNTVCTLP